MDLLESIYNSTENALFAADFRLFILKTFLISALLAGPFTLLYILCRSLYRRLYHSFRNDRRNNKGGEYHE